MTTKQQEGSSNELEIELISFARLKDYFNGKEKDPFESLKLNLKEGAVEGIKDDKGQKNLMKEMLPKKKDATEEKTEARVLWDSFKEYFEGNLVTLLLVLAFVAGAGGLVYILPRFGFSLEGGASGLAEKVKEMAGLSVEEGNEWELETPEGNEETVVEALDLGEILRTENIGELELAPPADTASTLQGGLTKEDVYAFLSDNLDVLEAKKIYFLRVLGEDKEPVSFDEMAEIMELGFMPGWETTWSGKLKGYRLMLYREPEESQTQNKLRLGLFLFFEGMAKPTMEVLETWEETMISDLAPFYFGGSEKYLTNSRLFRDSTVDSERRYVNFNEDLSVSLDYAIVEDGIIITTSKYFGTSIFKLLINNETKEKSVEPGTGASGNSGFAF